MVSSILQSLPFLGWKPIPIIQRVFILRMASSLDQTTGDCLDDPPTLNPFAPDGLGPWGFFFDPLTNDFFVTAWEKGGFIYHFTGFTPGVDTETVLANIDQDWHMVEGTNVSEKEILLYLEVELPWPSAPNDFYKLKWVLEFITTVLYLWLYSDFPPCLAFFHF